MRSPVLIVQHSADDPPGRLGNWLDEAGIEIQVVSAHLGQPLPRSLDGLGALIVLGGAMGAYDDAIAPWLTQTKRLLREATERDLPTLGICLGHQLLAVANHGQVARAAVAQVGLTPLQLLPAAVDDVLFGPLNVGAHAVHWNNDLVVQTPPGAVALSYSVPGVQAFRLRSRVWGVQFHPEVDLETVTEWARVDVLNGALGAAVAAELVAQVANADHELEATWRSFGQRFAGQVLQR